MPCFGYIGEVEVTSRIGEEELSVEWRIPDFLMYMEKEYNHCNYYRSPDLRIGDALLCLILFPNWERETGLPASGWVKVGLKRYGTGPPKTFRFSVGIRGSEGVENRREGEKEFLGFIDHHRWNDFCPRSRLMEQRARLMPDGVLTIECVVRDLSSPPREAAILPRSEQSVLKSKENSEVTLKEQATDELLSCLQSLLESGENCDVVIEVQGKRFPAHRSMLQARSPVFRAMFSHDMLEKQRNVVTVEDCDQDTFPALLRHIYTGDIGMISIENVFGLYESSEKYDLPTLKRACAEFVRDNLTVASFCDAITLALKHDDKGLIERATDFFCSNTLEIVKTAEWQTFLTENPTVGNELYIKQLAK